MADEQYCLKWNNHQSTLLSVLTNLMDSDRLTDCVLSSEGQVIKAHQVVISACSPYLEKLLNESRITPGGMPILIFSDLSFEELSAMKEYMYRGEVNIRQDRLDSFLKAASSLQIKGLTDGVGGGGDEGGGGKRPADSNSEPPGRRRKRRESKESDASHEDPEPPKMQKKQQVFTSKVEPFEPQPAIVKMEQPTQQVPPPAQVVLKPEPQDHHEPETHDLTGIDDDEYEEYDMPGPSQSDLSQDMSNWQMENSMNSEDFAASQSVMNASQPGHTSQGKKQSEIQRKSHQLRSGFISSNRSIPSPGKKDKKQSQIERKSHSLRSGFKSTNCTVPLSGKKDYSRKPDRKHLDELKKRLDQNAIKTNKINVKLHKVSDKSKTIDKMSTAGSRTKSRLADLIKSSGDIPTLFNRLRTRKSNQNNTNSTGILLRKDGSKLPAGGKLAPDRKFKPSSSLKSKLSKIQGENRNSDSMQAQVNETKKLDRKVQPFEFIDMSESGEKPETESIDRDPLEIASSPEVDPLADVPGSFSTEMEPSTTFPLFNFINPSSPPRFLKNITQEPEAGVVQISQSTNNNAMEVETIDEPSDEEIGASDDDNDSDYKIDEDDASDDDDGDSDDNLVIAEEEICALCHAPAIYNHVCHTKTVEQVQESEGILLIDSSAQLPSSSTNMVVEMNKEAKTKQAKRRLSQDSGRRPSQDGKKSNPSKSPSMVEGEDVQGQNEDGTDEAHICMICSSEFRRQKDLLLHGLYKHGETSPLDGIQCNQCEHTTSTVGALYSHLNSIHFNQPKFKCHHCIYEASDLNLFHMHIVNNHQKMINKNKLRVSINDDEK